jgi:hypothetical protein
MGGANKKSGGRDGFVMATCFWLGEIVNHDRVSGGCSRSTGLEGFCSQDAVRVAGCEMALDVESVVDSGMHRQEALS